MCVRFAIHGKIKLPPPPRPHRRIKLFPPRPRLPCQIHFKNLPQHLRPRPQRRPRPRLHPRPRPRQPVQSVNIGKLLFRKKVTLRSCATLADVTQMAKYKNQWGPSLPPKNLRRPRRNPTTCPVVRGAASPSNVRRKLLPRPQVCPNVPTSNELTGTKK